MDSEADLEKWESQIGKIVLSGSRVEYELSKLYEKYLPNREYFSDSYETRYDKAIGVAKKELKNGQEVADKLIEMKKYANYRHLIAHNAVHYSNETGSWQILDLKNKDLSINLTDIVNVSSKAFEVSVKLTVLLRRYV